MPTKAGPEDFSTFVIQGSFAAKPDRIKRRRRHRNDTKGEHCNSGDFSFLIPPLCAEGFPKMFDLSKLPPLQ